MSPNQPLRPMSRTCLGTMLAACLLLAAAPAATLAAQPRPYQKLTIVQPEDGSTVFSNPGHVEVQVKVSPAPELSSGDRLELLLDGTRVATLQGERATLDHVDRGSHRLQARIVDRDDKLLVESAPIQFQMWQASRNFPSRR